jgi:Protein of unknown function (DUF2914)/Tetratricopeptide repeat
MLDSRDFPVLRAPLHTIAICRSWPRGVVPDELFRNESPAYNDGRPPIRAPPALQYSGDVMPSSCEPRSVIDAAEKAAAVGDYASAEGLLRDAARQQEADLGPLHPDLANTLNNLGIVCEIINKPADAERCYRKAYAIATTVLEPDHPFAITSKKNLTDFCEAHRLPVDGPAPRPPEPAPRPAAPVEQRTKVVDAVQSPVGQRATASRRVLLEALSTLSTSAKIPALSLGGLALVMLMAISPWLLSNPQSDSLPAGSTARSETSAPPPDSTEPASPKAPVASNRGPASNVKAAATATAASAAAPTLVSAAVCKNLSRGDDVWRCDHPGLPTDAGSLFFYTRLKSPTDTKVQHRWYRGDLLYRTFDVRVKVNQRNGYRAYSQYTIDRKDAGNWRVELRSKDGILIHEERFVVRSVQPNS